MFLAHGPLGYITNELVQKKAINRLKFHEQFLVGVFAILFGILPDIDLLILPMFSIPMFSHHNYFTHSPLLYVLIWLFLKLIFFLIKKILNKKTSAVLHYNLINIILNTFLISTMIHFIGDIVVGSIMLLYPFSSIKISLLEWLFEPNLYVSYFFLPYLAIELCICVTFFIFIYKKYFTKNIFFEICKYIGILLSIGFLATTIIFHFQTYNRSILYDSNGEENYDIDYDRLEDDKDLDVDNDGNNNLVDVDIQTLVDEVKNVLNSNKLASNNIKSIQYLFGGFDSYRVISQAYFNLHAPIEPVLRDYYIDSGYIETINYQQVLYNYLSEHDLFLQTNLSTDITKFKGSLFFVFDRDNNILNMGIILDDGNIGIVLDSDKRLAIHTPNDIQIADVARVEITK